MSGTRLLYMHIHNYCGLILIRVIKYMNKKINYLLKPGYPGTRVYAHDIHVPSGRHVFEFIVPGSIHVEDMYY